MIEVHVCKTTVGNHIEQWGGHNIYREGISVMG